MSARQLSMTRGTRPKKVRDVEGVVDGRKHVNNGASEIRSGKNASHEPLSATDAANRLSLSSRASGNFLYFDHFLDKIW
jgi:hypothetical protein